MRTSEGDAQILSLKIETNLFVDYQIVHIRENNKKIVT